MRDCSEEISDIEKRVSDANKYLRIDEARKTVAEIELQVAKPDLWDDPDRARELTTLMARARADVDNLDDLYQKLSDVKTLYELSREEDDDSVTTEVEDGLVALRKDLDHLELRALFAGEHDERDAICEVHSGAGGTDAQDWTEMILCGCRTPNVDIGRRRRRRWDWRSFASSHGLRFDESTGNYGVPRVDRRGAALPRLGDSVCLFCFEPKSIYTYTRISVQPTSLVTALPRSYPDSWQHSD